MFGDCAGECVINSGFIHAVSVWGGAKTRGRGWQGRGVSLEVMWPIITLRAFTGMNKYSDPRTHISHRSSYMQFTPFQLVTWPGIHGNSRQRPSGNYQCEKHEQLQMSPIHWKKHRQQVLPTILLVLLLTCCKWESHTYIAADEYC